jgi:hypothetical protein
MISAPTAPVNDADEDDPPRPKPKAKPLPWSSVPPQSIPERQQALADLKAALADPELEYGTLVRMSVAILYAFSGSELRRILLGLVKLLEVPPPIEERLCQHCGVTSVPRACWQTFNDGSKHIRATCTVCGGFLKYLSKTPGAITEANHSAPYAEGSP